MVRWLLTGLMLGGTIFWLALTYLPIERFSLDSAFQSQPIGSLFVLLLVVSAALFLALQGVLLYASVRMGELMSRRQGGNGVAVKVLVEVFWTTLPIVMTIALIVVCYQLLAGAAGP